MLKKSKEEEYFKMWKLHEIRVSESVNKVLLENSNAHSFIYCL